MQTSSTALPRSAARPTNPFMLLVAQHPLLALFVVAYGVTWMGVFSQAAALHGLNPSLPLSGASALAVLGCPLAALLVEKATGGIPGRNALLLRYLRWRVSLRWYAVALIVPPLLLTAASALAHLVRGQAIPLNRSPLSPSSFGGPLVGMLFYIRGNWEEMCWRGVALPRIQLKHRPVAASLMVGMVWALWHLPYYFVPGHALQVMGFPAFAVFCLGGSVLLTWLFNSTNGSLLLVTLFHAAFGTWMQVLVDPSDALALYLMSALVVIAAGLVAIFTRGQLGLTCDEEAQAI